ncbi:toxin-antitoxin system, antitoxin component, Xre family protein [Methylomonas sp. TEB]|uniref:toxin-antitoxin system, antitoxin component, Xre family protein n=1 Tax=Methylomonas sp. TEB TaxID=3398229 RepID=UPI0039F501AE
MQPQVKHMVEKLEHLSPDRLAEVDDFIDFLQQRDQDNRLRRDFAHLSETAFAKLWNNDEDAIYDQL